MKAEVKPNYDSNRKKLADIIPISAPFTIYIEQTRVCNLKCFYCIHSTRDDADGEFKKLNYEVKHMDFNDYLKVIQDLKEFPQDSIKKIVFSGLGEPLANPRLPEMIKILTESNIAQRREIITNGLLLTKELSDKLIDAGLTNINISIQGINSEQYSKVCGKQINFKNFIDNLKYLYENRGNTQIYIKALDASFNNEDEQNKFYELFTPIADKIFVEHIVLMQQSMKDRLSPFLNDNKNFYGEELDLSRKVCSQAFYFLQIGCDLDTFPCPNPGLLKSLAFGNAKENSLKEIWNGLQRKKFLKAMLEMQKDNIPECSSCTTFNCISNSAENLDPDAEKLLKLFE